MNAGKLIPAAVAAAAIAVLVVWWTQGSSRAVGPRVSDSDLKRLTNNGVNDGQRQVQLGEQSIVIELADHDEMVILMGIGVKLAGLDRPQVDLST